MKIGRLPLDGMGLTGSYSRKKCSERLEVMRNSGLDESFYFLPHCPAGVPFSGYGMRTWISVIVPIWSSEVQLSGENQELPFGRRVG